MQRHLHRVFHRRSGISCGDGDAVACGASSHLLDARDELADGLVELLVRFLFFLDLVVGVQDGRMVAAAEKVADLRQRGVGKLAA